MPPHRLLNSKSCILISSLISSLCVSLTSLCDTVALCHLWRSSQTSCIVFFRPSLVFACQVCGPLLFFLLSGLQCFVQSDVFLFSVLPGCVMLLFCSLIFRSLFCSHVTFSVLLCNVPLLFCSLLSNCDCWSLFRCFIFVARYFFFVSFLYDLWMFKSIMIYLL